MNQTGLDLYSSSDSSGDEQRPTPQQQFPGNGQSAKPPNHPENRKRAAVEPEFPRKRSRTEGHCSFAIYSPGKKAMGVGPLPMSQLGVTRTTERPQMLPPPCDNSHVTVAQIPSPPAPMFSPSSQPPLNVKSKATGASPMGWKLSELRESRLNASDRPASHLKVASRSGKCESASTYFLPPQLQLQRPNVSTEDLASLGYAESGKVNKR